MSYMSCMGYNSYMLRGLFWVSCGAKRLVAALPLCVFALMAVSTHAEDWPQWGGTPARNMYCPATNLNLPDHFTKGKSGDIKFKGASDEVDRSNVENLKWVTKLGSQSYGNVTVAKAGCSSARTTRTQATPGVPATGAS